MTLQKLKKQIHQETRLTVRIGEKPLFDFRPETIIKDYKDTIGIVNMKPKHATRIHKIIKENNYNIIEKQYCEDISGNNVSYYTLKKRIGRE